MRFLLDTHALIWMDTSPDQISERAAAAIADRQNTILLSYASVWEMQIKMALGKLQLSNGLSSVIQAQQETNGIELLRIELPHIFKLEQLPDHHRARLTASSSHKQ